MAKSASQKDIIKRLQEERERNLAEIERLKMDLQAEIEPASSTGDDAAADAAADVYERSKLISLIQTRQAKIRSLDGAIEAAEKGSYGICEVCGKRINPNRLAVLPDTTICVSCAQKR